MRKGEKINYNLLMPTNFWAEPVYQFKSQTMFFWNRGKYTKYFVAFVLVDKIIKGKDYDVIYGVVSNKPLMKQYNKSFVCKSRNARHQIYTLHRGEYALIFGTALSSNFKTFYVSGIWATYVPKAYEIKKETNNDFENMSENTEKETQDFINELLNKGKEETDE